MQELTLLVYMFIQLKYKPLIKQRHKQYTLAMSMYKLKLSTDTVKVDFRFLLHVYVWSRRRQSCISNHEFKFHQVVYYMCLYICWCHVSSIHIHTGAAFWQADVCSSCHICIFIILFSSYLCHKGLLSDVNCVIQILNIFVNHQKATVQYALQLGNRLAYMSYIYTFSKPYKTIIC